MSQDGSGKKPEHLGLRSPIRLAFNKHLNVPEHLKLRRLEGALGLVERCDVVQPLEVSWVELAEPPRLKVEKFRPGEVRVPHSPSVGHDTRMWTVISTG